MAKNIYGIDFGTGTIKIYKKGEGIILSEKTAVSIVDKGKKPVAIGAKAYEMYEKAPPSIKVSLPIARGVISHLDDMVSLWNFMGKQLLGNRKLNRSQYYIAVPADITEVEKKAYSKIVTKSDVNPKKVFLVDKPIADAYGLGLDIEKARGVMIVNLGADTTELSVLSLGGIVVSKLLPYGGNDIEDIIQNYIRKQYNFIIGKKTAEHIKKEIFRMTQEEISVTVVGRDVLKGLPGELTVTTREIFPMIIDIFQSIAVQMRSMLERTPPEISSEIIHNGIFLTGGTSGILGLNQYFANEVRVRINSAKTAQKTVVSGIGYLAEHPKLATKYAVPMEV